jgi:hypothetical protein
LSWAKSMKWTSAGPPAVRAGIDSGSVPTQASPSGRSGAAMLSRPGLTFPDVILGALAELGAFLLPAVPLLALLLCLLLGRYPGCEAIVRLSERIAARGRPRAAAARRRPPLRPSSFAPGGGLLLALSLSGRAPPA